MLGLLVCWTVGYVSCITVNSKKIMKTATQFGTNRFTSRRHDDQPGQAGGQCRFEMRVLVRWLWGEGRVHIYCYHASVGGGSSMGFSFQLGGLVSNEAAAMPFTSFLVCIMAILALYRICQL